MGEIKIEGFAEDGTTKLSEKIEKYARQNKLKIKQISTYSNPRMMYSERAIVIFEKV